MSKRKNSLWKNLAAEAFLFLFLSIITVVLIEIHPIQASSTIYIRADGSIDPPTANITRDEFNVTYTFSGNNYETVVIQRDNIILDGAGFTLQVASADGIFLDHQSNVTIKNLNIDAGVPLMA